MYEDMNEGMSDNDSDDDDGSYEYHCGDDDGDGHEGRSDTDLPYDSSLSKINELTTNNESKPGVNTSHTVSQVQSRTVGSNLPTVEVMSNE